jgi:hypothetical protein
MCWHSEKEGRRSGRKPGPLLLELLSSGSRRTPLPLISFTPSIRLIEGLTFESEDLLLWVHDGGICSDWPSHDRVCIVEVDDDDVVLVAHADKRIRLEGERLERDRRGLDTESGELDEGKRRWARGGRRGDARRCRQGAAMISIEVVGAIR